MDWKKELQSLRESQAKILSGYEALIKKFDADDMVNENTALKSQVELYKKEVDELKGKWQQILQENQFLRYALQEQILDEKLNILKISGQKLKTYFQDSAGEHFNRLDALEHNVKQQLLKLKEAALAELYQEKEEILQKIDRLALEIEEKIKTQRARLTAGGKEILDDAAVKMKAMGEEPIEEALIQKRIKQNQIEMKIGLNLLNKIGMFFILLGVGVVFQWTYNAPWFTNIMKCIFFFLLGALCLVGGEVFHRKAKDIFAKGLLGGGIAILYSTVFYGYFMLNRTIPLDTGLFLLLLITSVTIVLSLRYNSQSICSMGLAGGYLPFITYVLNFGLRGNVFYLAMGYLFILNTVIVFIAFWRKWHGANYTSFIFNIPSLIYLVFNAPGKIPALVYAVLTFIMYLAATLAYPLKHKIKLKAFDVILLGLNTFISCVVLYGIFEEMGLQRYRGLMALFFCLIYIGLGRFVGKAMKEERSTLVLFYATALTFAILVVPFQFGRYWLSLGWLVEGVLLAVYGYKNKSKYMEMAGWGIFGLCLAVFFLHDYLPFLAGVYFFGDRFAGDFSLVRAPYFDLKYLSVTAGLMLVLIVYLLDMQQGKIARSSVRGERITVYKNFVLINLWLYIIYIGMKMYDQWVPHHYADYFNFYRMLVMAVLHIGTGYFLSRVKLWEGKFVKYFYIFLYIIGDLICLRLTMGTSVSSLAGGAYPVPEKAALFILAAFNVLVFFNIRDIILRIIREKGGNLEFCPLLLSIYLLWNVTAFLNVQLRLGNINLLFSFAYLVLAICFLVYGFVKKYVYIRRFGLGLALFSTAKLFLYDLAYLDTVSRIFAYFGFGFMLLAISYLYQKAKTNMGGYDVQKGM